MYISLELHIYIYIHTLYTPRRHTDLHRFLAKARSNAGLTTQMLSSSELSGPIGIENLASDWCVSRGEFYQWGNCLVLSSQSLWINQGIANNHLVYHPKIR